MDSILEHYGVKGMRWGIRKSRVKTGSRSSSKRAARKAATVARKKANAASRKTGAAWNKKYSYRSSMSDRDLKRAVERLRLENEFGSQLSRSQQYIPKTTRQKIASGTLSILKSVAGTTGDVAKTAKNVSSVGGNTIATYRYAGTIKNLKNVKYRSRN